MNNSKRNSKIAHLPQSIRDQINHRLFVNHSCQSIAEWLNSQSDVQAVLAKYFGGSPVSQQNVAEWKYSGYSEWLDKVVAGLETPEGDLDFMRTYFRSVIHEYFENAFIRFVADLYDGFRNHSNLNQTKTQPAQGNSSNN